MDLAGAVEADALAKALNVARVQRAVTNPGLYATLDRHPRRGARALRALLDAERGPNITRSEAERRALALMREHGIEPDETDCPTGRDDITRRGAREMRELKRALERRRAAA